MRFFLLFDLQGIGIHQGVKTDLAPGAFPARYLSAGKANAVSCVGMIASNGHGIGQTVELDDLGSLIVVKIKADLLLKMNFLELLLAGYPNL